MGKYSNRNKIWKNIFIGTTVFFFILSLLLGLVVFFNWDYISFKALMTQTYLKTDILDELIEEHVGVDPDGRYITYFDNLSIAAVTEMIKAAGDRYTYQDNPAQYESYTNWREEKAAQSHVKELTPDTVYMLLTNFTPDSLEFFKESLENISSYPNLVLDLRNNGGGDIKVILEIADYFVEDGTVMLKEFRRRMITDIRAKTDKTLEFENLIVLQNGGTASAAEQLLTVLTYSADNVTTVGTASYGKYVGQTRIALLRGFYVKATTLEWVAPDGTSMNADGIQPDITYTQDDILDYVLESLL